MMAPDVSIVPGIVISVRVSFLVCKGRLFMGIAVPEWISRIEYLAVKAVAARIIVIDKVFVGVNKACSMIRSFE